ncbi:hypothetical protein UFOVP71_66 [uncultured Caudovirales phage]|uniref:Uncharacterized protein n=1 Tax=uncultured Caudovirales phage TaxID=2100421 RepID=A0A6J5T9B1_9CAUD|nr:hypothetical protein UFOVP71_66 [uncultured Caudovirales phage]
MDKHNDDTDSQLTGLEMRLAEFIKRFDMMTIEMTAIKRQQADLIELIKAQYKK